VEGERKKEGRTSGEGGGRRKRKSRRRGKDDTL